MDKEIEDEFKQVYTQILHLVKVQEKILIVLDKITGEE